MSSKDRGSSNKSGNEGIWVFSSKNDAQVKYSDTDEIIQPEPKSYFSAPDHSINTLEKGDSHNKLYKYPANDKGIYSNIKLRAELFSHSIKDWLTQELIYEQEQGNFLNIAPVFLGGGIWTYFSIKSEPNLWVVLTTVLVLIFAATKIRTRGILFYFNVMLMLFVAGMAVAQLQVNRAQMYVPNGQITSTIKGIVLAVDKNTRGSPRYMIRPSNIEQLAGYPLPRLVRISTSKKYERFKPGDTIEGLARLASLPGPAYPGGYDFAFFAWFKGHAMSGFFMGAPKASITSDKSSIIESVNINISNWRNGVSERIRQGIEGEAGDLAVALITGDRSGLSNETQESLRKSGLAHILAISGLHMALVTLTMVWVVRSILLFIPNLASNYSIKKWAICTGFVVATFYLFLSGNAIATQRAWLMISIMMLASLLDRPAITIRNVSVAAFIILVLFPASLFSPGFQMSFAAVVALVSVYRSWGKYRNNTEKIHKDRGLIINSLMKTIKYGVGLSATSLIAGTATAFFAAWHFHRIAPLGFIANLAAMPIVSLLVMPLALASVLLMPYGLESLTLVPLGHAINAVVWVSKQTNLIPMDFSTGVQSGQMLIVSLLLLSFALLPVGRLKYISIIPVIWLVIILNQPSKIPHLLIGQDGRTIAAATHLLNFYQSSRANVTNIIDDFDIEKGEGALTLLYPRRNKFVSQIWLKAYSNGKGGNKLSKGSIGESNCDKEQCKFMLGNQHVYIVYNPKLLPAACKEADILAAPRLWYVRCESKTPKVILKRQNFEKNGSHAIWLNGDSASKENQTNIKIETAWRPVKIAPTPNRFVERSNNSQLKNQQTPALNNHDLDKEHLGERLISEISLDENRRPWLKRYTPPKRKSRINNNKSTRSIK